MGRAMGRSSALLVLFLSFCAVYVHCAEGCSETNVCMCSASSSVPFLHGQDMMYCGDTVNVQSSGDFGTGSKISSAGDINGDGTEDFAVSNTALNVVYVIFGKEDATMASTLDVSGADGFIIHGEDGEEFGAAMAGGYDVNSDGFDDLVIGAPGWMNEHGRAFVIFGSDLFPTAVNLSAPSAQFVEIRNSNYDLRNCSTPESGSGVPQCPPWAESEDGRYPVRFGMSVSGVADVNDDGLHDFLIGSRGGQVGAVLVMGRALGASWPEVFDVKDCDGETNCARLIMGYNKELPNLDWGFGMSVTGGVDFNNDGLSDMLIGSPLSTVFQKPHVGMASVFYGSDVKYEGITDMRSLDGTTGFVVYGLAERGTFGSAVQAIDDLNGDGIGDFAVASGKISSQIPGGDGSTSTSPHVFIFFGFGFDSQDENPRADKSLTAQADEQGGFTNPLSPTNLITFPHTTNDKCASGEYGADTVECSAGFVIRGPWNADDWFGSSMAAGDLNNDDKTDLIINTKNSVAYILWGQDHANNFTTIEGSQAPVVVTNGDTTPICIQAKLLNDNWQGACGYMDLSNESSDHFASLINTGQISKVTLGGGSAHELAVIGDINKDSLSDMAYVDGATLQIIPGKCNDHGDSCEKQPNLPPGCKMDLARLLVGFIDDDFLEWGRGYIRYVMEQMETDVRAAWDANMLAKGFYVNTTETQRCWCSPPDQRGMEGGTWYWHCFELDDLICSEPNTEPQVQSDEI